MAERAAILVCFLFVVVHSVSQVWLALERREIARDTLRRIELMTGTREVADATD